LKKRTNVGYSHYAQDLRIQQESAAFGGYAALPRSLKQ
jgi:hypothetical protein